MASGFRSLMAACLLIPLLEGGGAGQHLIAASYQTQALANTSFNEVHPLGHVLSTEAVLKVFIETLGGNDDRSKSILLTAFMRLNFPSAYWTELIELWRPLNLIEGPSPQTLLDIAETSRNKKVVKNLFHAAMKPFRRTIQVRRGLAGIRPLAASPGSAPIISKRPHPLDALIVLWGWDPDRRLNWKDRSLLTSLPDGPVQLKANFRGITQWNIGRHRVDFFHLVPTRLHRVSWIWLAGKGLLFFVSPLNSSLTFVYRPGRAWDANNAIQSRAAKFWFGARSINDAVMVLKSA